MRHVPGEAPNPTEGFEDIEQAEFYFGRSWGDQIFTVRNNGGLIGVSTSAWGMFLATCRITFKPGKEPSPERQPVLERYIDFEMANLMADLVKWLPDKDEMAALSWFRQKTGR